MRPEIVQSSPPGSQEAIIDSLLDSYDQLPGQLQICARYIVDHPHEVGLQSMRTLATDAGVHPNSFVRLAKQLARNQQPDRGQETCG